VDEKCLDKEEERDNVLMVEHPLFLRMEINGTLCCGTHVSQNRENLLVYNIMGG